MRTVRRVNNDLPTTNKRLRTHRASGLDEIGIGGSYLRGGGKRAKASVASGKPDAASHFLPFVCRSRYSATPCVLNASSISE
ncbi:hypothetical protein BH09PLA1_BH09PLA1_05350 [soil metagenome]